MSLQDTTPAVLAYQKREALFDIAVCRQALSKGVTRDIRISNQELLDMQIATLAAINAEYARREAQKNSARSLRITEE